MGKGICLSLQSNLDTWLDIYSYSAESLFTKLEHGREGESCALSRDNIRKCCGQSRMAETMCDPILSCPRYKNLASSRLAHNQRRETNKWRWRKRTDGGMWNEKQHGWRRNCSKSCASGWLKCMRTAISYVLWMTWIWCVITHTQTLLSVPISEAKIVVARSLSCPNNRDFSSCEAVQKVIEGTACRELRLPFFRGHLKVADMWAKHTQFSQMYSAGKGVSCC